MLERIIEVRAQAEKQAQYYTNIGFAQLAADYMNTVSILNDMEDIVKENIEMKARLLTLEAEIKTVAPESTPAQEEANETV
jgi:hypothetical protein